MRDDNGGISADALVNCGNTLASLARLRNPAKALQLLEKATNSYREALKQAEDAEVGS